MLNYFPRYFTNRAIALYFLTLLVITFVFFSHSMSSLWMLFGAVTVVGFFYSANVLTKKSANLSPRLFVRRLFITAIVLRVAWVVFSYFFYLSINGEPYEFNAADSHAYNRLGIEGANAFRAGNFNIAQIFGYLDVGDMGYTVYLSLIYFLTDNNLFISRLLKALWGALMCVLVYKVAVRNFGENVGRMAAIFSLLMPNLIYYCGLQLKEIEMLFVTVAFVERADFLLRSKSTGWIHVVLPFILAFVLFTFRTVLGVVALFSLITALVFSTERIVKWQRRALVGVWIVLAIAFFAGGQIATEVEQTWEGRNRNFREAMDARAQLQGGNIFAKYGARTLFAPAIFIIPIPTFVNIVGQENQQLIHGGNYVKDLLAFFLLIAFMMMLKEKRWREYAFLMAFMFGYLLIIAFSSFAQSERFHLPALPIYLMFVALGVANATNGTKKFFNWYLVGICIVFIAWNWIKLAGRGIL